MKRAAKRAALGVAAVAVLGIAFCVGGARVNTTKSIPVGLYWASNAPVEKGAYVMFCPPRATVFDDARERGYIGAGFCLGGYGYMMKRVLAAKDDFVSIDDDGVRVNGALLPLSTPLKADTAGRSMPRYRAKAFTVGSPELLLMSDLSGTSFDGRYFGPINRTQVAAVLRPVITW